MTVILKDIDSKYSISINGIFYYGTTNISVTDENINIYVDHDYGAEDSTLFKIYWFCIEPEGMRDSNYYFT